MYVYHLTVRLVTMRVVTLRSTTNMRYEVCMRNFGTKRKGNTPSGKRTDTGPNMRVKTAFLSDVTSRTCEETAPATH